MTIENPMQTQGFEFVEFAGDPDHFDEKFRALGFTHIANHKKQNIRLYRQGQINFIVNSQAETFASDFAKQHGNSPNAMGFRVADAKAAHQRAISLGATAVTDTVLPGIEGIGGSHLYFVENSGDDVLYEREFDFIDNKTAVGNDLQFIDHLTHNVRQGQMNVWYEYYEKLFNFRQIRYFDIKGLKTGLISRALASPCGKIKIPINEATDPQSQIEEFITEFNGEGIQHIALHTESIYKVVEDFRQQGVSFLDVPDTYYEAVSERVPWHHEDLARLQDNKILMDGGVEEHEGLLLQIFTENTFGPTFFEIIQRKGNDGFGEGNFQALFEAIERDQMRRGVL